MSMTLTTLVSTVQSMMGDISGVQYPTSVVTNYLNLGLMEVARKTEYLIKSLAITSINSDLTYTLPADFLQVYRVLWDDQPIWPNNPAFVKADTGVVGTPFSYYPFGSKYLKFYPAPSSNTGLDITLEYLYKPTAFASGSDVSGLPDHMDAQLIDYAVARCKFVEEDLQGYSTMKQSFEESIAQARYEQHVEDFNSFGGIQDVDANLNGQGIGLVW